MTENGDRRNPDGRVITTNPTSQELRWHMSTSMLRQAVTLLAVLLSLASCATAPAAKPSPEDPNSSRDSQPAIVAEDLNAPWSMTFYDQIPLVSERDSAHIIELDNHGVARVVAVIGDVEPSGEGGLLGLTVHDDYLYAYLTTRVDNRIERYPLSGSAGALELGVPETVLAGIPAASNHNGGRIEFGPDGMLYAAVGDAGNPPAAQSLASLSGKILRMTPGGDIPTDNPFEDSYVFSLGHRNPQGLVWDDGGTLYASEFGQNDWDELNVIEAGANYGWPTVEGMAGEAGFVDPVQQWRPVDASPSGMAISAGSIWIANLRGERLWEVPLDDLSTSTEHWVAEYGRLRDVVLAPDGALWVLTNNTDGRGIPGTNDDRILSFVPNRRPVQ